jgi:uncharacterized protein (UPF0218 family)
MYYKLNPSVRKLLAHPMGQLFTGPPNISLPKAILWMQSIKPSIFSDPITPNSTFIICVGDVISKGMLDHPQLSKIVKMCFVDGETQRGQKVVFKLTNTIKQKTFENPRGMINEEIFTLVKKWQRDPLQYLIYVKGEEDLLVLPMVIAMDTPSFVFYGQPPITDATPPIPAGCVGIYSDESMKNHYKKMLDRFDKVDNFDCSIPT